MLILRIHDSQSGSQDYMSYGFRYGRGTDASGAALYRWMKEIVLIGIKEKNYNELLNMFDAEYADSDGSFQSDGVKTKVLLQFDNNLFNVMFGGNKTSFLMRGYPVFDLTVIYE